MACKNDIYSPFLVLQIRGIMKTIIFALALLASNISCAANDWSGMWWVPTESGWGVSINQSGSIMFVTMYAYDSSGNPSWYVASNCAVTFGQFPATDSCVGDLYQVTGGTAATKPWNGANKIVTKVGSVSLIFPYTSFGPPAKFQFSINGITITKNISQQLF